MNEPTIQHVPVETIACRKQVRQGFDEEALVGLAQSIRQLGVLQPLLGRLQGGQIVLVDGERRLRAARMAGLSHVPMIIEPCEISPCDVLWRQLILDVQRVDLTDAERGKAFLQLMHESGWTAAETSRRTGVSQSMISRLTAVVTDPQVAELVSEGRLPGSTGYALVRVRDSNERSQLIKEALEGRLTRDGVVARAKSLNRIKRERKGRLGPCGRVVLRMEGRRTVTVVGPDLTASALTNWLGECFSRLAGLSNAGELSLAEVASLFSGGK